MTETYCILQWPIQATDGHDQINLSYDDYSTLEAKLKEFVPPMREDEPPCGETIRLIHRSGQELLVGISAVGWMLQLRNPTYGWFALQTIYSLQELDEEFELGFNRPGYTDFPNTVLHEKEYALKMIKGWLDTGEIPVFLVPDRELGFGLMS